MTVQIPPLRYRQLRANENNTQVFVGGVYQEKATYSISNAVLTFTAAPANGVSIEVVSIAVGQINSAVQLADADGDTKVMVEESSDEDKIRFDTGGTERMIIDSNGKVGIGTSSPSAEFHVKKNDAGFEVDIDTQVTDGVRLLAYDRDTSTDRPMTVSSKSYRYFTDTGSSEKCVLIVLVILELELRVLLQNYT